MSYSYEMLRGEYEALLARMVVTRPDEVDETARRLLKNKARYEAVTAINGVPVVFIAPSFDREASSNFDRSPAQGDPLDRVSHDIPRGLGPYEGPDAWLHAALDAYRLDGLDRVKDWTWPRLCFEGEAFNGFGPRLHRHRTGYLWAGTNIYDGGKYVADGVWDPSAIDHQLGIIPVARRMAELDHSLDLTNESLAPNALPPPGFLSPEALQRDLNLLGADPPLEVDGNYGRMTRRAIRAFQAKHGLEDDGVAGPRTRAVIAAAMAHVNVPVSQIHH